jgi:hypothetical protein
MGNIKTLKPFQSGPDSRRNLNGRPKGSKNLRTLFMRILKKKVMFGGEKMRLDEAIALQVTRKAAKGNLTAAGIVMDRVDGKVPESPPILYTEPQIKVELTAEEEETITRLFRRKPHGEHQ